MSSNTKDDRHSFTYTSALDYRTLLTEKVPAILFATMTLRLPSAKTRYSPSYSKNLFPAKSLSNPY